MAQSYLIPGVDLLSLECITAADVQQAIAAAVIRSPYGLVVVSDDAPDVAATAELARFLWLKSVGGVPNGEFYYYNGTSWTLLSIVDGDLIIDNSIPLSKLSLSGAAAFNIIQVNAAGTALQYISIVGAIQDGTIPIAKLSNLGTLGAQDANNVNITGGSVNVATLVSTNLNADIANLGHVLATNSLNLFPTTVSLLATDQIIPTSPKLRIAGNGGPVTLTSLPTVAAPTYADAMLLLMGSADAAANPVTLQADTTLLGSKLRLGAATRVLGIYDTLLLCWDSSTGFWVEVAYSNNS